MANIIDGKAIAKGIRETLKGVIKEDCVRPPKLAVILVGNDPASQVYVRNKERACAEVGIETETIRLPETISVNVLRDEIFGLDYDGDIDGILVQFPLPKHLNPAEVSEMIRVTKDVDGLHPKNVGKLVNGQDYCFAPCTPLGIVELLKQSNVHLRGKHAVIVGRSALVGRPLLSLLLKEDCTVTICHSKTVGLAKHIQSADIVIAAIGKPKFITGDMLKPGCVVIDVGINRLPDGTLCGDCDFDSCSEVASHITPVPGGVGPMTIAMLLDNTVKAAINN